MEGKSEDEKKTKEEQREDQKQTRGERCQDKKKTARADRRKKTRCEKSDSKQNPGTLQRSQGTRHGSGEPWHVTPVVVNTPVLHWHYEKWKKKVKKD
ncbi:hypothetical protein NDU88_004354 [Pleurodeles waltl]|uniref:Uncharacterized protein n=1 Tax=Pleurodeles waltl TaxID=8319 RepID=A0AAV7PCJ5_PLEWA|nr:hypothetical protein NDU88_004351 [Pleurodeles waltl]KAJ1125941.1 hypothetical protein NDU88_004354 [Pleurodeles waltl]